MGRGTTRSQSSRLRDIGSTYRLTATREGQSRPNRSPKGVGRNHVIRDCRGFIVRTALERAHIPNWFAKL